MALTHLMKTFDSLHESTYIPVGHIVISFVVVVIICVIIVILPRVTKRWILNNVTVLTDPSFLTAPLFIVQFMDTTHNNNVSSVGKEWKKFRGSYFPTYGYTGGLFTELEELFPGEFVFPRASYSSFANNEERCKVLYSALKNIENHPTASRNDVVLQFLGLKFQK